MATRLWIGVLLAELAIAASVAALCAYAWSLMAVVTCAIALAVVLLLYAGMVALTFLAAHRHGNNDTEPGGGPWWRALWSELGWFALAQANMIALLRRPRAVARGIEGSGPPRPVLLLHGFGCNHGVWASLSSRLRIAGCYPVHSVDLEPLGAGIDHHVAAAVRALGALFQHSGGVPVTVVGHSMGGLVARLLLAGAGRQWIRHIVTIGTPHHGTLLAHCLRNRAARQLRPASPWLERLNSAQEGQLGVMFTSLYSLQDNIVTPARSAVLAGADNIPLQGLGHFGLLGSSRAHAVILAAIARDWSTR
jgi:triacylglycerol esterase/lipase EstA (alpha/beta hydrolase family)